LGVHARKTALIIRMDPYPYFRFACFNAAMKSGVTTKFATVAIIASAAVVAINTTGGAQQANATDQHKDSFHIFYLADGNLGTTTFA
jgi:hypothetical protein